MQNQRLITTKKIKTLILLILSSFILSACNQTSQNKKETVLGSSQSQLEITKSLDNSQTTATISASPAITTIILTTDEADISALDLLQKSHEVEIEKYDFGVMIKAIDGLASDQEHYWAFYVNDEYAQVGADQQKLQKGDTIKFNYEKIQIQ